MKKMKKEPNYIDYTLITGNVRVDLTHIGEGYNGAYDEKDPTDKPLLRFYVYVHADVGSPYAFYSGEDWEAVENSSYCTNLVAINNTKNMLAVTKAAKKIMGKVKKEVENWRSVKKICEELSWLGSK